MPEPLHRSCTSRCYTVIGHRERPCRLLRRVRFGRVACDGPRCYCGCQIEWLEERWQEDLEVAGNDTRDLLEEVCGSLRELVRLLHRAETARGDTDDARRVLYHLHKVDDLTCQVDNELGLFNAQMLGFLVGCYEVGEVCQILAELNRYAEQFLVRLHALRQEIAAHLTALLTPRLQDKIATCLGLVVYTAGFPNAAVMRLVSLLPKHVTLQHWGDSDLAGLRIAAMLQRIRPVTLWRCEAATLDRLAEALLPLDDAARKAAASYLARHPDFPFAAELRVTLARGWLEQEAWRPVTG